MQDSIIIGFSTHKSFNILSEIIKIAEHTAFSHVYIKIYSDSLQRWLIYQASGLTVNFVGQDVFHIKNKEIAEFTIPITPAQKIEILQIAIDLAGKPYGMKDLIGIGYVRVMGCFAQKVKNPFADGSKTYICSELAATLLTKIGIPFADLDSTTPKDVYDTLIEARAPY